MSTTTAVQVGKKYQASVILDPDQMDAIDAMVHERRTTRAAILREAVDTFLAVNRVSRLPVATREQAPA